MKLTRLIALAVILGSVGLGSLTAQTVSPGDQPAEFPPSSFQGKQYVDSKGCVFIRAGIDGNVSWIPRVTRKRTGVCGFKPTFAGQVTPAETVASADVPIITLDDDATAPVVASASGIRPVAAPKSRTAPVVIRQSAPVPQTTVRRSVAAPSPQKQVVRADAVCPNASAQSQQYYRNRKLPIRCGPQDQPVTSAQMGQRDAGSTRRAIKANGAIKVSPQQRIAPLHVAINRVNTTNGPAPKGYRKVWKDDRLNPYRAQQTLEGHRAMQLIWTSTVPRRLVNQTTGEDVTAKVALVYPYTDYQQQQSELGEVTIRTRGGRVVKRVIRSPDAPATVYSSRSVPPKAVTPERAGKGYVQVGKFIDADAAQRIAQKVQRMGLPVRIGRYTRSGQTYRLVIAGPFADGSTKNAVSRLHSAGFSEAFARR